MTKTFCLMLSLALLPALLSAVSYAGIEPAGDSVVVAELRHLEETFGGHLGLMAKDLKTGRVVRYNHTERFPTASLIKLPIMGALFDLVDRGVVNPARRITLTAGDKVGGSGTLQSLADSASITLLDAAVLMTVLSDNTATNLVLDHLASSHDERLAVVNDFLTARGMKDTRLLNRLYSIATKKDTRPPRCRASGRGCGGASCGRRFPTTVWPSQPRFTHQPPHATFRTLRRVPAVC